MVNPFRTAVTVPLYILGFSALNLILFQYPVLQYIISTQDTLNVNLVLKLASTQALQLILMVLFFSVISLLSLRIMKVTFAILFIVNSAALYFLNTYNVELSRWLIESILHTNTREAFHFWHPSLLYYVLPLGLVPAVFALRLKLKPLPRPHRTLQLIKPTIILFIIVGVSYPVHDWYEENSRRLGGRSLPLGYILNGSKVISNKIAYSFKDTILLPDPYRNKVLEEESGKQKTVVVLAIGESARPDRMTHFGHTRDTTPYTKQFDLSIFPVGQACGTITLKSTTCMLTKNGRFTKLNSSHEPLHSYLTRQGVYTILRDNNDGTPPLNVNIKKTGRWLSVECQKKNTSSCPEVGLDGVLARNLLEDIQSAPSDRVFVTLHFTGSHGPAYWKQYPNNEFNKFIPTCKSNIPAECKPEELLNTYDNTILYTDYILANVIEQLQTLENTSTALIYVGDHGESLGEGGLYEHSTPTDIAPIEQLNVPFWIWMSKSLKRHIDVTSQDIIREKTHPSEFVFHSILGLFELQNDVYKSEYDVFHFESPSQEK